MTDVVDDRDAEQLARLNREVDVLTVRAEQARQAWAAAHAILVATQAQRDDVARRVQAARAAAAAPTGPPAAPPGPPRAAPGAAQPAPPEASTRTVQNVLFILGGLLLATAAVVFTAVAWATYGVTGRATILAAVTVLALLTPLVALWRGLTATAETFAGVGLVLVVLDGYAAWYVDLFDVTRLSGSTYAAAVCAVTAAVAVGYRAATRLVGPAFAAVVVAQPIVPLLAVEWQPPVWGWSMAAAAVAAADVLVVLRGRRLARGDRPAVGRAISALGWVFASAALLASAGLGVAAEGVAETGSEAAWAGGAVIVAAAVLLGAAASTRSEAFLALAGCAVVIALASAVGRFAAIAWPQHRLVTVSGAIAAVVLIAGALARMLPGPFVRPTRPGRQAGQLPRLRAGLQAGVRAGTIVSAAGLGAAVTILAVAGGVESVAAAFPAWHGDLVAEPAFDWQLITSVALAALAIFAIASRRTWGAVGAVAIVVAVLAVPGSFAVAWWAPAIIGLAFATALAGAAVLTRPRAAGEQAARAVGARAVGARAAGSLILLGYAVLTSLARAELTASILGALAIIGVSLGLGAGAIRRGLASAAPADAVAGVALAVGLASVAPAIGSCLVALDTEPWWTARLTTASVALVIVGNALVGRFRPRQVWYAFAAAVASALVWPLVGAFTGSEPVGVYAGVGLVALAFAVLGVGRVRFSGATVPAAIAAIPAGVLLGVDVLLPVVSVVIFPYGWVEAVWSGAPSGVGLAPAGALADQDVTVTGAHAIALGLLAVSSATTAFAGTGRIRSAIGGLAVGGPTAILVGLTAARAPWPTVPAAMLALGIAITMVAGLAPLGRARMVIAATQGMAYLGAGLAAALSVEWFTLTALGSITVAGAVVGAAGRGLAWRVGGSLTAATAALATAAAAGFAADLEPRTAAFPLLGAAAAVLAGGAALARRRPRESVAVQAAAHAGAVVALMLTAGHADNAAAVCALWGIAVGFRALSPGTPPTSRRMLAGAAGGSELLGWWLLLASRDVSIVEAYTVPLAAAALVAGWVALRSRPDLRSWVAYGPALAAGFLPSLATSVAQPDDYWRRVLLFVAAIAVVVAGAVRRLQAPIVVGGAVTALVALHEIVLYWAVIPRWIPLAIGGLLLVGLAITYERRRRDLIRLRAAVARMR